MTGHIDEDAQEDGGDEVMNSHDIHALKQVIRDKDGAIFYRNLAIIVLLFLLSVAILTIKAG